MPSGQTNRANTMSAQSISADATPSAGISPLQPNSRHMCSHFSRSRQPPATMIACQRPQRFVGRSHKTYAAPAAPTQISSRIALSNPPHISIRHPSGRPTARTVCSYLSMT